MRTLFQLWTRKSLCETMYTEKKLDGVAVETPATTGTESQGNGQLGEFEEVAARGPATGKECRFIGQKLELCINLQGVTTQGLWDTGSQISLVSSRWMKSHLPQVTILPMMELIGHQGRLTVEGVGQKEIPYAGYVPLELQMGCVSGSETVTVPFLVCDIELKYPIVGTNVIEYILKGESVEDKILHLASLGLQDDVRQVMSTQLALKFDDSPLTSVSIAPGAGVSIPVGAYRIPLSCRIEPIETEVEIAVLFEPKEELRTLCPDLGF